ncbi:procollagen C-endopeptidase enhancer 1-like [Branchiostoma floridae x Branchiostoma belcheri]
MYVTECPLTRYNASGIFRECSSLCQDVSSAGSRVCTGPAPDQCHACSYRSADGTCTSGCNPGQKAVPGTSEGTFICQACRSGYRCVNGDQVDEICPAGTYSNTEGTDCDPCPAGQYSGSAGSTSCTICPAGRFSARAVSTSCTVCPADTFSSSAGSTSCQQCPAGTESTAGSTSCSPQYSGCQDPAILSGDSGTITSPGYPGMYPPNLRCSWTITVSRGRLAAIRFTGLDIEFTGLDKYANCFYDSLTVFDGATSSGTQLGKFCGSTIPPPVVANGRTMHLVFISDHSRGGAGFSAVYTADTFSSSAGSTSCQQCPAGTESTAGSTSCSPSTPSSAQYSGCQNPAILSGDSGTITSPGYPGMYPPNIRCSWTITVSRGRRAAIRITSLDMEMQNYCPYDYLAVFDGANSISDSLVKLCGNTIPSPVVASGRTMFLVFVSDGSVGGTGFSLEYAGV